MKRNSSRRLWALVLALALTLSLVPPAWGDPPADPPFAVKIENVSQATVMATDGAISLRAEVSNGPTEGDSTAGTVEFKWKCTPADLADLDPDDSAKEIKAKAKGTAGEVTVTVTATWTKGDGTKETATSGEVKLTIEEKPSTTVSVTGVTLNERTLSLAEGASEILTATVTPADATNQKVTWESSDRTIATVDDTGKVTAVKEGAATITVKTEDGGKTDTCAVTVEKPSAPSVAGLEFTYSGTGAIVRSRTDDQTWDLSVRGTPAGADISQEKITWTVNRAEPDDLRDPGAILSLPGHGKDADDKDTPNYTNGPSVKVTSGKPGRVTVTAAIEGTNLSVSRDVVVSGILLNADTVSMEIGETKALAVAKPYGMAEGGLPSDVVWMSADPKVATVSRNGELISWSLGSTVITASKNGYTAECFVEVKEDEDSVIDGVAATTSDPLIFDTLYQRINQISQRKTGETEWVPDEKDPSKGEYVYEEGTGSPLDYITNVKVPTDQGTLYYNYDSESNTGAGVGANDRFAYQRSASIQQMLDKLYFVPKQGYSGTAEITFTGWAKNGSSFAVTVRVDVAGSQGIRYKTTSGQPAYFQGSDFNAYCRTRMGRDLSYVTFNLPQASKGGLYYGYTGAGQYAGRVSTTTQYGLSGREVIDDVCFVPTDAFVGELRISFRGVDTAGKGFTGEVIINVTPSGGSGETANIYQTGQWGQAVTLRPELFNAACQSTIGDTLAYVRFQLPSYDQGVLYYNYQGSGSGSRVDGSTRYHYSGNPGLGAVTFVPASNSAGRVAIPYTGYGDGGTSYTGTLYITLGEVDRATVRYSVAKEAWVSFAFHDFNEAALLQMGTSLEYIEFHFDNEPSIGTLYYDYRGENYNAPMAPDTPYYREPKEHWQQRLELISFQAGAAAGSASIPFTAYSAADKAGNRKSCQGTLVLQVGGAAPADISLSGYTSGQFWLSAYEIKNVCAPVMNRDLSYIEITGLPDPKEGVLYYGYQGFKTGIEVKRGDRYYCMGAPNIDQLSFIPWGSFFGQTQITYIGYSADGGEQVSGRIVLSVSRSGATSLYNDMGRCGWAVDAVEFLSRNGTVNGVGGGRYNPTGGITKGDFCLMLVRAFGFKSSGNPVSYSDVPAGSYYAQAISIASQKGIAGGWNGRFEPKRALTRQEAMLMIYNALKADGHPLNNGLTADLDVYRDSGDIASSARTALGALILMGVVEGDGNGTLRPKGALNRAETACLMHRLMTLPGSAG